MLIAIPAIAAAAPARPGPYVSGFLGASFANEADISTFDSTGIEVANDRVSFDPGINVGGTGGYDFGFVRLEGEISYKHHEMDKMRDNFTGTNYRRVDGNIGALAVLFNSFVDFHNDSPITPYIGGGIGFATLHLSDTFVSNRIPTPYFLKDDASVFAYQAGGGIDIALNRIVSLDVGYRYLGTDKAVFDGNSAIETYETKFNSHNFAIGVRVKF